MTLYEFAAITQTQIEVYHEPMGCSRWIARMRKPHHEVHFKEKPSDHMVASPAGWGDTPQDAMKDLCKNLDTYRVMVVDGINGQSELGRASFGVPKGL